jgi:hypothetical protein
MQKIVMVESTPTSIVSGVLCISSIYQVAGFLRMAVIDRPRHVSSLSDVPLTLLVDPRIGVLQSEVSVD